MTHFLLLAARAIICMYEYIANRYLLFGHISVDNITIREALKDKSSEWYFQPRYFKRDQIEHLYTSPLRSRYLKRSSVRISAILSAMSTCLQKVGAEKSEAVLIQLTDSV